MSEVRTNSLNLASSRESALGTAGTTWRTQEPNSIAKMGATLKTVSRAPISKNRQRRRGTVVDLDSTVEFECDLTMEALLEFIEGFMFASFNGGANLVPTAVTTTGYTVASGGALTIRTLVYVRGCAIAANNGLKVVTASSTSTEVKTTATEQAEASIAATANATIEIAGVQADTGDFSINSSGNLVSVALNFTTLNLTVGQWIRIGGSTTATQFAIAANTGLARITAIAANLITLDKKATTFATDDGTSTGSGGTNNKTVQIFFGQFARNVAVDDADFITRSYSFELTYPELGGAGVPEYKYSHGNYCNEIAINVPGQDKATMSLGFVGTVTDALTTSRSSGASTPLVPVQIAPFNTSTDFLRLRITQTDETAISTYFKSAVLTLKNQVAPAKALANLGAVGMNYGIFEVGLDAVLQFTDPAVAAAVRNNTAVTMELAMFNDDGGGFVIDLPTVQLGGGDEEYAVNEEVRISVAAEAVQNATLGTSLSISFFPYTPD